MSQLPQWKLTSGADLAIFVWGEECVVHHRLSNDTHRMAAWLVPGLQQLGRQSLATLNELQELLDADEAAVIDLMEQLEAMQLVQRC